MKHIHENISGWFNFRNQYDLILSKIQPKSLVVEVGSYHGKSLSYLVVENINKNLNLQIHAIDLWGQKNAVSQYDNPEYFKRVYDSYDIFLKNTYPIKDYFTAHRMISWEGASLFVDNSIDYVFIDAGHDEVSVYKDLCAWYPKVKPGGYIGGDDYSNRNKNGVKISLDKFCAKEKLKYNLLPNTQKSTPGTISKDQNWYILKK